MYPCCGLPSSYAEVKRNIRQSCHVSKVMTAWTSFISVKIWPVEEKSGPCSEQLKYLDLSGSRGRSLFSCVFRVFPWFFDECQGFIADWCVVDVGGERAGRTRRWALWGWWTLLVTEGCRHWTGPLDHLVPVYCPLSPKTDIVIRNGFVSSRKRAFMWAKIKSSANLSSNVRPLSLS